MDNFKDLGVSQNLIKRLDEMKIKVPTDIQVQAIPFLLEKGTDFIGQAQTGTGKTAAFGLPLLQRVDASKKHVQALVLAPTRELAQQIAKQLFRFTKYYDRIFTEGVYGGVSMDDQISALQRPTHIVVATPGRLLDLVKEEALSLEHVETVVLDEADEMLSMGFKQELNQILDLTTNRKSTWLFSATIPEAMKSIINKYMDHNSCHVQIDRKHVVNRDIQHYYMNCRIEDKVSLIVDFLDSKDGDQGIVFCRTRAGAITLGEQLNGAGFETGVIQGELSQKDRDKVMRAFKKKRVQVLVATDVAARGIDVEGLGFVIHHQLPEQNEYYTHRSGRTGRAGNKGVSLSFVTKRDLRRMKELEKDLGIRFDEIGR